MTDTATQDSTQAGSDTGAVTAPPTVSAGVDTALADSLVDPLAASVEEGDAVQFANPNSNFRGGADGHGPRVGERVEDLDDVIADLEM